MSLSPWAVLDDGVIHWSLSHAPSTFSPNAIAGCQLWLDAADSTTIELSNSVYVARWIDKSAVNTHHATPDTRVSSPLSPPTYTPSNVVFNGSACLNTPLLSSSARTATYFIVFTQPPVSATQCLFATRGSTATLSIETSSNCAVLTTDWTTTLTNSTPFLPSLRCLVSVCLSPETVSCRMNGGSPRTGSSLSLTGTPFPYELGAGNTDNRLPFTGTLHELVAYNTVLSDTDRQAVEAYLLQKWDIGTSYISDGLVYHADAGNPASYSTTTPSVWRNLIPGMGLDIALCNSPVWSPANGGNIQFCITGTGGGQYGETLNGFGMLSNFSLEALHYYIDKTGTNPELIVQCYPGSTYSVGFQLGQQYGLADSSSNLRVGFYNYDCFAKFTTSHFSSTYPLPSGNWYHIVATYDMQNFKLYVNNTLQVTTAETATPFNNTSGFRIMRNADTTWAGYWGGYLGAVRIYNRALSAAEVTCNYNGFLPRLATPSAVTPDGRWSFLPTNYTAGSGTVSNIGANSNLGAATVGATSYTSASPSYITMGKALANIYVRTPSQANIQSIILIVRVTNGAHSSYLLDSRQPPDGIGSRFVWSASGGNQWITGTYYKDGVPTTTAGSIPIDLSDNTWHHLCFTFPSISSPVTFFNRYTTNLAESIGCDCAEIMTFTQVLTQQQVLLNRASFAGKGFGW